MGMGDILFIAGLACLLLGTVGGQAAAVAAFVKKVEPTKRLLGRYDMIFGGIFFLGFALLITWRVMLLD